MTDDFLYTVAALAALVFALLFVMMGIPMAVHYYEVISTYWAF